MADTQAPETVLKKRNDAYTGFLAISFLAMTGATVLMYLEYQNYENKTPPKAPTIDVPGAQLKTIPGSGGPPLKVAEPKMTEPDMKDMNMMMRQTPAPSVLPKSTREAAQTEPVTHRSEPVIRIPEVSPPMAIIPAAAVGPVATAEPIVIPSIVPATMAEPAAIIPGDPTIAEPPPLPMQRFVPPPT